MFFTLFWVLGAGGRGGGGAPTGWVPNLLMQFFTVASSKIKVFEICFFDTLITMCSWDSRPGTIGKTR